MINHFPFNRFEFFGKAGQNKLERYCNCIFLDRKIKKRKNPKKIAGGEGAEQFKKSGECEFLTPKTDERDQMAEKKTEFPKNEFR